MGNAIIVFLLIIVYLLPMIVATQRDHRNTTAITVLNIFLGWTFLGWVIALVWACTDQGRTVPNTAGDAG